MQLSGKAVFITGSAQGLGKAYATALLERGAKVCLSDVNQQQGETTLHTLKDKYGEENVFFVACDVSNEDQFKEAFSTAVRRFGNIDIMVNNAGIMNESIWEKMVAINVNGVIIGTNLALDHMRKDKNGHGGTILNIASGAGFIPATGVPVYCATKHAVIGLTRSWAANPDCEKFVVRFASLCPAFVDTALLDFPPEAIINHEWWNKTKAQYGVLPVETVSAEFIKLLENEDNNGAVLFVHPGGADYKKFD